MLTLGVWTDVVFTATLCLIGCKTDVVFTLDVWTDVVLTLGALH